MPSRARSLNLPPRSTSITDPSAFDPAGIAAWPPTRTSRTTWASTRSSTRARSLLSADSICSPSTESAETTSSSNDFWGGSGARTGSTAARSSTGPPACRPVMAMPEERAALAEPALLGQVRSRAGGWRSRAGACRSGPLASGGTRWRGVSRRCRRRGSRGRYLRHGRGRRRRGLRAREPGRRPSLRFPERVVQRATAARTPWPSAGRWAPRCWRVARYPPPAAAARHARARAANTARFENITG